MDPAADRGRRSGHVPDDPYYTTEATLLVARSKVAAEGKDPPRSYTDVESWLSLLENRSIELSAMQEFGLRDVPWKLTLPKFGRLITARHVPDTDLISLQFSFPDPGKAQQIAKYLVDKAIDANRALNQAEVRDTQKFLEHEQEEARNRRERLNQDLLTALSRSDTEALAARIRAFGLTFAELETQRREAMAAVAAADASVFGLLTRPALRAKLDSLESTITDVQKQADIWSRELSSRKQILQELTDRYESADREYRQLTLRTNEARIVVGSRSQDLKLLDAPYLPERPDWPRRGLFAAIAFQLALLGTTLVAFLLDYIALRRSRL